MTWSPPPTSAAARAVDCCQVAEWSREVGWDIEYQQLGRGSFNATFSVASCRQLRLTSQCCNRQLAIYGAPPKDMVAVVLPSGSGPLGIFEGMALRPNDAIVLLAGDGRSLRSPSDFRACTVSVPRASLESALWHYAHHELSTLVPESRSFTFSPKRVLELAGTICSLTSASPGPVGLIALAELEDRLLQSLAGEFCRQPLGLERHSGLNGRADHVRRARDYIEAHLKQPIPLSQVAVDAGVSIRTLELAFREVLGVTPLEYILTRRLNRVRQHLLDKGRVMGTLADLAVEYGLFHLGRFSREYKALFGELPSETLVRSRR